MKKKMSKLTKFNIIFFTITAILIMALGVMWVIEAILGNEEIAFMLQAIFIGVGIDYLIACFTIIIIAIWFAEDKE